METVNFLRSQGTSNEQFNIHLNPNGELEFNANNNDGQGPTRMVISDSSGQITIGGSGQNGALQFKSASDGNTILFGVEDNERAIALFGGENIDSRVDLFERGGTRTISLQGGVSRVNLFDRDSGTRTISLRGDSGNIVVGPIEGGTGINGDLIVRNEDGEESIRLNGEDGSICYTELAGACSDRRYKQDIRPLKNCLNKVLAMCGVTYFWNREAFPNKQFSKDSQIGFIGQEVETTYPEVVFTNSEGYKSLDYSRLTPVLVEAIKEQHQLIKQQTSALGEALEKIAHLETKMQILTA